MHAPLDDFEDVKILDNFYQTSSFFPMPVVVVSTVCASGQTNLGPYSLCFPHVISGQHAMLLIARGNSNTAENLRRTGVAALNFIPDDAKLLENCVVLGFPGESTEQKMKDSLFTLVPSKRKGPEPFPRLVAEAVQVFECSCDRSAPYEVNGLEHHYLLRIENTLMHPKWHHALLQGGEFPRLPVDYGYRDAAHFWFSPGTKPYSVNIPEGRGSTADVVRFDGNRIDPAVTWSPEACEAMVNVPRIFLKAALTGCVEAAKAQHVTVITPEFLAKLRDKRGEERPPTLFQKLQRFFSKGPLA